MSSSPTVTLFTVHVDSGRQPAMLAASALIHGALIALISYGILHAPRLTAYTGEHYLTREIDLVSPKLPPVRAAKGIPYPGHQPAASASGQKGAAGKAAAALQAMMATTRAQHGPQTLLQPDIATKMALQQKIPIPQMLIWRAHPTVVKKIVAPPPQPPTTVTRPSFDAPNRELTVGEVNLASSPLAQQKLKIMPSTTSPVAMHSIDTVQVPPATVSQIAAEPTPAAVMSLSNLHVEGTATLPPVNESAMRESPGALSPATAHSGTGSESGQGSAPNGGHSAAQGSGEGAGAGASAGAKQGPGKGGGNSQGTGQGARDGAPAGNSQGNAAPGAAGNTANGGGRQGQPNGGATGPSQGASTGNGQFANTSATEVTLPKTGVFNSVVVGNSLQEQYPELADVWNGRMAYTVYLHVGLARSWILQYSLPANVALALNGRADHLEAPWPYSIVRPNLPAGSVDADALMVHGFVNAAGRFEGMSVVVPQGFPQSQFVLDSLARWQFRPAAENGQAARVEVLLIIPEAQE